MAAAILAGCAALREPKVNYVPNPGPAVSEACLDAAVRGVLVSDSAQQRTGRYAVKPISADEIYLRREGRALSEPEGQRVFESFRPAGLSTGSSALYSVHRCPDVPRASCLHFSLWLCQTGVERLAGELDAALEAAGVVDGEIGLVVHVLEARGPKCKPDATCPLDRHYGSPDGAYDAKAARRPLGSGGGRCDRDNDCEGGGSNACQAWYLRGGAETLLYVSRPVPTFCGCIEQVCTWFDQP